MLLKRTTTNNGYWCGCCHRSEETCGWVDDCSPADFIRLVYQEHDRDPKVTYSSNFEGVRYEREGQMVYECRVTGGRRFEEWHLAKPTGEELLIYAWYKEKEPPPLPTEEEALAWWLGQEN